MGNIKYYILAILACLGWGSAFTFIKLTLDYAPTFQLSGMRFILSGVILLPFLLRKSENWSILIKEWRFVLLFSFFQIFMQYSFYFSGVNLIPVSVAAIVVGSSPLVVFVMAHYAFHDDKFTPTKIISVALGVFGVVIMTLNDGEFSSSNPYYIWGIVLVLLSVLVNSFVNIIVAKNSRPISPIMLTAVSSFLGGVMLLSFSFVVETPVNVVEFDVIFWVYLFALAVISSLGFSVWFYLLKVPTLKVSEINIWKFIVPVFGAILGWLLFPDDTPNLLSIVGVVSITLAIIILQFSPKKEVRK